MIDKTKIKTVFLDIDDTVWWFTENSKVSLRHVYDYFGLSAYEPSYEVFRDIYLTKNHQPRAIFHRLRSAAVYASQRRRRYYHR